SLLRAGGVLHQGGGGRFFAGPRVQRNNRENVKDRSMNRLITPPRSRGRGRAVRTGRPPRELAGEVDTRILDAARRVFLERGLAGTSMDEIARLARAGKPTIYARFPNKEALFTAVVMQSIAATIARYSADAPIGATIEERLKSVAVTMLEWILVSDSIRLMRIAIAEASRFPDLATSVFGMGRERAAQAVARLLAEAAQS